MSTVLRVNDITMQFGGVVAVNNLSMHVDEGEIVALIGPNGAGKTTAFNCITGVYEPTNGEVWFHDRLIASNHPSGKMKKLYAGENRGKYTRVVTNTPDRITKMGIARTFQNLSLIHILSGRTSRYVPRPETSSISSGSPSSGTITILKPTPPFLPKPRMPPSPSDLISTSST